MSQHIHLLETDEPLQWPTSLIVRCGLELAHAQPVWMFREDFKPTDLWLEGFNTLMVCKKCLANPPNTADDARDYLYGLVEGVPVFTHDEDCPCYGDTVEHAKECSNCTCQP